MNLSKFVGDKAFYKRILVITTPIMIQNVITNFVSLLDNIMVGQVGTEPMSGVAIVNQLIFIFNLCIFGGLSGAGIFTAQYYGKNDQKGVRDTFRAKLYIAFGAVLLFAVLLLTMGDRLILLFLHEGNENLDLGATLAYGKEYLLVMLIQLIPFAISQAYSSTLREIGETLLPMKSGIAAVVVNTVFNYILIFGKFGAPELGVVGAAVATVLSRIVECAILLIWTHTHKNKIAFINGAYRSFRIPVSFVRQLIKLGTPLIINEVLWAAGMAMLNQCYSLRGLEVVSATNISSTIANLFFCAFFSMGNAISIIVGQLLGAGKLDEAVDADRKIIAFSVFSCLFMGVVMAIAAPLIPRIYNTSATVKNLAAQMLIVNAVLMPANAFTHTCYFTLRSGGKTIITFIFDSASVWLISVSTAFVLSHFTGLDILPMYIIVQCLELIKCTIGFILVKKRTWVKNLVDGN